MSEEPKKLLSAMLVLGAQSPEKAMSIEELASKLAEEEEMVEAEVGALVRAGYAKMAEGSAGRRFYLSGTGIITASSTYS